MYPKIIQPSFSIYVALVPGSPVDTTIHGCSSPVYTMALYWYMTCALPPVQVMSFIDDS